MKLSKNLSLEEVTKSITAKRRGIDNTPDEWVTENLRQVAINIFQPVRDHFKCPIFVSSGYRSAELNKAIGGSKRSQHVEGEHSTLTQMYLDVCRTVAYSTTYERTYNLISSFGSLVMKIILIGCTCLTFTMALIVAGASRLFETIREKCTTK